MTRGEGAESQATESVREERQYPLATAKVLMDMANWGAVQWSVHPVFNKAGVEDCEIDAAESGGIAMKGGSIDFKFVYGKPVEFYQETVPVKIARILDVFRAPEAAKDQLGMKLYDIDALSTQGYKELLKWIEPTLETADPNAQGEGAERPQPPMMAFVTALYTGQPTMISSWGELAGMAGKFEYIGVPVQWNEGLVNLLGYEAGESELYRKLNECAEYNSTKLIKRAMYDVIASVRRHRRRRNTGRSTIRRKRNGEDVPRHHVQRHGTRTRNQGTPAQSGRSRSDRPGTRHSHRSSRTGRRKGWGEVLMEVLDKGSLLRWPPFSAFENTMMRSP